MMTKQAKKKNKRFTDEEIDNIIDALEKNSLEKVAKKYGRTVGSIRSKLGHMGMGVREVTGFISSGQLADILGVDMCVPIRWINEKDMPVVRRFIIQEGKGSRGPSYLIDLNSFWVWANKNRELLNLTKMDSGEYMPDWARELRNQQLKSKPPREGKIWTTEETKALLFSISNPKVDLKVLAKRFGRSVRAIEKKIENTPEMKAAREKAQKRGHYTIRIGEIELLVSGVNKSKDGNYLKIKDHPHANKKGLVSEGRVVMEQKLGRFLKRVEVVFRNNDDKFDNRPENLYIGKNGGESRTIGFVRIGETRLKMNGKRESDGYKYLRLPEHPNASKDGFVLEHRVVMEQELGRFLKPWERVMRKNKDRSDNRPENLYIQELKSKKKEYQRLAN